MKNKPNLILIVAVALAAVFSFAGVALPAGSLGDIPFPSEQNHCQAIQPGAGPEFCAQDANLRSVNFVNQVIPVTGLVNRAAPGNFVLPVDASAARYQGLADLHIAQNRYNQAASARYQGMADREAQHQLRLNQAYGQRLAAEAAMFTPVMQLPAVFYTRSLTDPGSSFRGR
jgi:hypothetical protein